MGTVRLSEHDLDVLLGLQLTVAWAGEGKSQPPRLGWWRTDLFDETGGADLFTRLAPRTHEWAKLEALREVARRADERCRSRSGTPDRLLSVFHLGFDVDERLRERIASHKVASRSPADALGKHWAIERQFDRAHFTAWAKDLTARPATEDAPAGRRLLGPVPAETVELGRRLVSSLVPLSSEYLMPHVLVER